MKWLKRSGLFIAVTALLVTSVYLLINFWLQHSLKEHQITHLSWQVESISTQSSEFALIEFTYQNQFKVQINNLNATWNIDKNRQLLQSINIETLSIKNRQGFNASKTNHQKASLDESLNSIINLIQQSTQADKLQKGSNLVSPLAYLPQRFNIKEIYYSQPCFQDTNKQVKTLQNDSELSCAVNAYFNWQTQLVENQLKSIAKFNLQESRTPEIQVNGEINLTANLANLQLSEVQLNGLLKLNTLNSKETQPLINIEIENQLTSSEPNNLHSSINIKTASEIKHQHFAQTLKQLNSIHFAWLGSSLPINLSKLSNTTLKSAQNNARLKIPNIQLTLNSELNLAPLNKDYQTNALLNKLLQEINLNAKLLADIQQPITVNKIGDISGNFQAETTLKKGVITHYDFKSQGTVLPVIDSVISTQAENYGIQLPGLRFSIQSSDDLNLSLSNPLSIQASLPIKAKLSSFSLENNRPINKSHLSTAFDADILANIELTPLNLDISSAKMKFKTPLIKLNKTTFITNTDAQLSLSGFVNQNDWNFQSSQGFINTDIQANDLSVTKGNLSWQNIQLAKATPVKTLKDNQLSAVNSSIKSLNIKGDITHKLAQAESINLDLKQTKLEPVYAKNSELKNKLHSYQFTTRYQLQTAKLQQPNLLPQSWKFLGKLKAQYSPIADSMIDLNAQGSISNKAGLVAFHNAFYTPKQIYSDWVIPPIYFLAGNSLQKTFKDWPKLLTLGSGTLEAKGTSKYNLSSLKKAESWQDKLYTQAEISSNKVSGIFNETTINQLTAETQINLKKNQFIAKLPELKIVQINHGIILGPIELKGEYQAPLNQLTQGKLNLHTAKTDLFNGQAWLNTQQLDFSQPFLSKLHLSNIDLHALLQQYPSADIEGSGRINGELPFKVNLLKKPYVTLPEGFLKAKALGGQIKYQPTSAGLKQTHQSMELVMNVLEDFHYSVLNSNIRYGDDNKLHLKLSLQGKNPAIENGRQVNFNIQLEEDLPALITSMQISNQVSETIKKRIQNKLQSQ
ncbi:MAG: YdbH domain-containing protein [Pseudomonadota bacterium]|nr:YdbH domain-containing protein [Pseudomonadota bacterium]